MFDQVLSGFMLKYCKAFPEKISAEESTRNSVKLGKNSVRNGPAAADAAAAAAARAGASFRARPAPVSPPAPPDPESFL